MSAFPLENDICVAPVHSVCFAWAQLYASCLMLFMTKIVLSLQKDCFISMCHPWCRTRVHLHLLACIWAFHFRLSLLYPRHQPLRSRCRSKNTATIDRMRSMALWPKQLLLQVMSPTWSTTSDYSETHRAIFQNEPVDIDTEPSYSFDAELDDELIRKALSSPLFSQEREEPANLRKTYHSHEESLLPAQSFFTRTSTGKPVYEPSSNLSQKRKSSRDLEHEQIKRLLERQKEQILAEVRSEIQKHKLQAESDRRSIHELTETIDSQRMEIDHSITGCEQSRRDQLPFQEEVSEQNRDLREHHIKSLSWDGRIEEISRVTNRWIFEKKLDRKYGRCWPHHCTFRSEKQVRACCRLSLRKRKLDSTCTVNFQQVRRNPLLDVTKSANLTKN